jgi:hypothetical protein
MRTAFEKASLLALIVLTWAAFERAGVFAVVEVDGWWYVMALFWVMSGNDYTQRVRIK